ncbi:MAG: CRTAC1 family protein [Phycisphaerae bacterium]|nr:CRTAC1 family protein [Saprospiraceae bacterium]
MLRISIFTPQKSATLLFSTAILLSCLLACTQTTGKDSRSSKPLSKQQQNMLQILADVSRKVNTPQNMFSAEAKLAQVESDLASTQDQTVQLNTLLNKSVYLLEYGDEQQSVAILEQLRNMIGNNIEGQRVLLQQLGTAYLRLAERNNCLMGHNEDACIMPIRGKGVHADKTAAKQAAASFEVLLTIEPDNYDALWLLNITYMTLGGYPQKVPKKWLIPNLDAPGYPVKPFFDMATDLNVMVNNRAGGSIVDDFDNDGYLDLVTSAWDLSDPMHYFKNNGDGTFTDRSAESGLKAYTGGLNIQQTDYNNDGYLDIWVLRGAWQGQSGPAGDQPNSLFRNNGDGTFTDVTIEAGLLSFHPTQTATWNDFNHDGWIDVFVGNETSDANAQHFCEFYINNKNGTFTNVAADWGLNIALFVKGVASGDYDNDGWPDLFLSTMSGQKVLLRNKGLVGDKVDFENVSEKAGFNKETYHSFPTFFFDYDNDGWLDLFVCNYEFEKALSFYAAKEALHPSKDKAGKAFIYHNNRNGTFTNVSERLGLHGVVFSMGSNFGDINNDGWLDMYLATGNPSYRSLVPNKLFVNLEGKKFADATNSSRTGNLQKGHGVSFADLDNDGDQDIHVDLGGAFRGDAYPNSLYINPGQNNNNWIYLQLEGTKSNRAAIGTKITVKFHENGKERMVYRELNSGGSFGSSPLRREIGIGQATVIDEITINWPASGITQVLKNVQPNQLIKIKEGQEGFAPAPLNKMTFKRADGSIPMCAPTM